MRTLTAIAMCLMASTAAAAEEDCQGVLCDLDRAINSAASETMLKHLTGVWPSSRADCQTYHCAGWAGPVSAHGRRAAQGGARVAMQKIHEPLDQATQGAQGSVGKGVPGGGPATQ